MAEPERERLLTGEQSDYDKWLQRMEYNGQPIGERPGTLTFWMLVLNSVGFLTHTFAFVGEVAAGARFNMYLELYTNEVTADVHNVTSYTYTRVVSDHVYITWIAVSIHFVSMAFHALVALFLALSYVDKRYGRWYLHGLFRCRAWWRWLEYFVSASLMIYLLVIMMGVRNTQVVWAVTSLCAVTMLFGWITEVASSRLVVELPAKVQGWFGWDYYYKWKSRTVFDRLVFVHLAGYIPFVFMFTIILDSFFKHRNALGDAYPGYTDYTVIGTLVLFLLFGITQLVQQAHTYGPSWYALGEATYVALSFLAKAWLVVIVTAQVLANPQFDGNLNAKFS